MRVEEAARMAALPGQVGFAEPCGYTDQGGRYLEPGGVDTQGWAEGSSVG